MRASPRGGEEIEQVYRARRSALQAFDPELVIAFGSDHFIGFMEPQTWIAASADRAGVCGQPVVDFYGVTEELGIATGIVHGD